MLEPGGQRQCWTWSGFRIAIQPDSAIQNRIRIGLDFKKNLSRSDMDIQTALITAGECLIRGIFGYKPDWIKYLDSGTGLGSDWMTHWKYWTGLGLQKSSIRSTLVRVDHGAGLLEWTPGGDYDFCQCRSRTWSRIFEWKPDPEQEWEFQFLQESDNWFYFFEGLIVRLIYSLFLLDKLIQWWIQGGGQFGATSPPNACGASLNGAPLP